jgi:hypothetical protein
MSNWPSPLSLIVGVCNKINKKFINLLFTNYSTEPFERSGRLQNEKEMMYKLPVLACSLMHLRHDSSSCFDCSIPSADVR